MIAQLAGLAASKRITVDLHDAYIELRREGSAVRMNRQHAIYLRGMLLRFDYYFSAVRPEQDGSLSVADYSAPRFHQLVGFDDFPAFFHSYPEPMGSTDAYLKFAQLKPGHQVLDLGAYAGMASILFSRRVGPTGHVAAYEPDLHNFKAARINIDMHTRYAGYSNISLHQQAVWSDCNGIEFSCDGNMGSSASSIVGRRGKVEHVASTTLEAIMDSHKLDHLDFIKMDIEGAEIEVIGHSLPLLKRLRPALVVESHRVNDVHSAAECATLLRGIGYETWTSSNHDQFSDYLLFAR